MSSIVEQIKSRLSIIDVIGSYIKLEKSGSNFKARCPFHNEKTPSFYVSTDRDSYHCFGCDKGGDIINFIEEIEGVDFLGAIKILAEKAGIKIEKENSYDGSKKGLIFELLESSTEFYRKELIKNKQALEYLRGRGLNGETIKKFKIGYAPDEWRSIYNHLKKQKYTDEEIEKAGMVIRSEKGFYDRFRGRIMFPIFGRIGNIIGFSGRIFTNPNNVNGNKEQAKYINSPQTIIYDKSNVLYGINFAKVPIRTKNLCVLVEGQMDLIMSHQAGVENVIAVSGTALTEEHLGQISRLANTLIIAFDGDSAGIKASERAINSALKLGIEVRLATLPKDLDPADIIKNNKEDWGKIIEDAKHIVDFFLESENLKELSIFYTASIKSKIEQARFVNKISEILRIDENIIWEEIKKISRDGDLDGDYKKNNQSKNKDRERTERIKNNIISFLLWQNKTIKNQDFMDKFEAELINIIGVEEFKNLKKINSAGNKILEMEIAYSGIIEPEKELKEMLFDLKEEVLRKKRADVWNKIKEIEKTKDKKIIDGYLKEFDKISKKLDLIKKEKINLKK